MKQSPRHYLTACVAWGVVGGLIVGLAGSVGAQPPVTDDQAAVQAETLSRAFRQAAAKVLPTVVTIKTLAHSRTLSGAPGQEGADNPFRGTPFEELFQEGRVQRTIPARQGLGSGVIIDADGVVLTNNHVVAGMDEVVIEMADGKEFKATEILTDPGSELAVVRIKSTRKLPTATLGDSDKLQIGDWVLAIGSPFGLDASVSAGIISAKGRALRAAARAQFLQTDAVINPGNSGGPLVNLRGEVIGVNTAIASRTGTYQGIGFAIPINLAKWVSAQLVENGRVRRAYLGVGVTVMTAEVAEQLGMPVGQGVYVYDLYPESPAARAGLQVGDVITQFERRAVNAPAGLQQAVEKLAVGATVRVTFVRDGRQRSVNVTLEELPAAATEAGGNDRVPKPRASRTEVEKAIGIDVQDLTARLAKQLGYKDRTAGVLVTSVAPNSIAGREGIRPGHLILRVHKTDVLTVRQFRAAIATESLADGILLHVASPVEKRVVVIRAAPR